MYNYLFLDEENSDQDEIQPFQSVQVKIELGHIASQRKSPSPDGYTHDWKVFVRGPEGCNIAHFIEKVVFHLDQSFPRYLNIACCLLECETCQIQTSLGPILYLLPSIHRCSAYTGNIAHFIEKVVFHLDQSFLRPKRGNCTCIYSRPD
jgi:hypothetical protein